MTAQIIPFPDWQHTGSIGSEADMVSWAIQTYTIEKRRYPRLEAVKFGKLLWAAFQERAQAKAG